MSDANKIPTSPLGTHSELWPFLQRPTNLSQQFENPFTFEDLLVFDTVSLRSLLNERSYSFYQNIMVGMHQASAQLKQSLIQTLPPAQQERWHKEQALCSPSASQVQLAQHTVLDTLFWDLVYWKLPELYDELTDGEPLHPDIFLQIASDIHSKEVLDAGAGSGRSTRECLHHGARHVYAIDPSPGLLHLLKRKFASVPKGQHVTFLQGSFEQLPLEENSVDVTIACSAFRTHRENSAITGLAEMKRVTRSGGKIIIIWPHPDDYRWLAEQQFSYTAFPPQADACIRFRSLESALRCANLFYHRNQAVREYLLTHHVPAIPFAILGRAQPCDYCWLVVKK